MFRKDVQTIESDPAAVGEGTHLFLERGVEGSVC